MFLARQDERTNRPRDNNAPARTDLRNTAPTKRSCFAFAISGPELVALRRQSPESGIYLGAGAPKIRRREAKLPYFFLSRDDRHREGAFDLNRFRVRGASRQRPVRPGGRCPCSRRG